MKFLLILLFLSSCNPFGPRDLKVGDCIIRYENAPDAAVLKVHKVLERGYILKYWKTDFDDEGREVFEEVKLYRGKALIQNEYKQLDCEAQSSTLRSVEI